MIGHCIIPVLQLVIRFIAVIHQAVCTEGSSVIQLLPVASIVPFPNHPFGVRDDQDMEQLMESIQEHGILSPLTVRVASDGTFELISGHKRKHAAEKIAHGKSDSRLLDE